VLPALPDQNVSRTAAPRDQAWLSRELGLIWDEYFFDTPRVNGVHIGFYRPWKLRLGLIRLNLLDGDTYIGLNSLLSHHEAPYCVTLVTVAHELVHYCHGFGSPLPQKYKHPHRGGIVTRELVDRGLGRALGEYSDWIEQHWWSFYARRSAAPRRRGAPEARR
jgi:hypothetical protein